jgi:proteasome accessory factor B
VIVIGYADPCGFASWIVGYGADVEVLEPAEVRDAVIDHLREMIATMGLGNPHDAGRDADRDSTPVAAEVG